MADIEAFDALNKQQKSQWYGISEQINVHPPKTAPRKINMHIESNEEDEMHGKSLEGDILQRQFDLINYEGSDNKLEVEFQKVRRQGIGTDVKGVPVDELGEER